jgi:DNA polymerase III delta prime subunit
MLFPSTILASPSNNLIAKKIESICSSLDHKFNQNNPDLKLINSETGWGIEQIREIKKFLSQKPFNHQSKIIVIEQIENLNIEAQNALLKTLEEPGNNNYIILTTNKLYSLLPTITSRCNIIKIADKSINSQAKKIIITKNLLKDLTESEKLSQKKEEVLSFLKEQLSVYQKQLIENPNLETASLVKKIIKAINMINSNVDSKSAMDFIFLN